jgi:anti-sigma factor RsiW
VVSRRKSVSADDLQDFIEGRLSPERRAEVEAYLQAHPAEARRVEALREQAGRLRRLGSEMLVEPVPAQFLDILKRLKN